MTGATAVFAPINALAGNSGKLLAAQPGADASAAEDRGEALPGFADLFAMLAEGNGEAGGTCTTLVVEGEAAGAGVPIAETEPMAVSLPAKAEHRPLGGAGSAKAALALLQLNSVTTPIVETVEWEAITAPPLDPAACTTNIEDTETDASTASAPQPQAETPVPAPIFWAMPVPQAQPLPDTMSTTGTAPDASVDTTTDSAVPDLLAKLTAPPLLQNDGSTAAPAQAPSSGLPARNIPATDIRPSPATYAPPATPSLTESAALAAVNTSATVTETAPRNVAATGAIPAASRAARPAAPVTSDTSEIADLSGTESIAPTSVESTPTSKPSRPIPATPDAPKGQSSANPAPAQNSASRIAAPISTSSDADVATDFTTNLTASAPFAPSSDTEAARDPASLTSARITTVQQETYYAPVPPQSPVQQIADSIADELASAPAQASPQTAAPDQQFAPSADNSVKVLHLQLNPPDLGPLTVRMTLKHETLDLQLETGKQETAKLIDNDRDTLFGLLRQAGYSIDGITVQAAARGESASTNSATGGAFQQSSGQTATGGQQSQGRASSQSWQGDGRGDGSNGGNGRDGSESRTSRADGGALYL